MSAESATSKERRKTLPPSRDYFQRITELEGNVASIERPLQSLIHDTRQSLTVLSSIFLLEGNQEDSSVEEIISKLAEDAKKIRDTLQKTFSIVRNEVQKSGSVYFELLPELLQNRHETLQLIIDTTLPSVEEHLQEFSELLASIPLERLKDPDSLFDSLVLVTSKLRKLLGATNAEIKKTRSNEEQELFPVDVGMLVLELKPVLDSMRRELNVRVELNLPKEKVGALITSPPALERVIISLVTNAKDASVESRPEDKVVVVSVEIDDTTSLNESSLLLKVTDRGSGMSEEMQSKIFESDPFTSKGEHGSGYGLIGIKDFVKENKGRIEVASSLGEGTTFFIYLPLRRRSEDL